MPVSRQAKGANLRHEVYHPESISDSICQGLRKWHSHPWQMPPETQKGNQVWQSDGLPDFWQLLTTISWNPYKWDTNAKWYTAGGANWPISRGEKWYTLLSVYNALIILLFSLLCIFYFSNKSQFHIPHYISFSINFKCCCPGTQQISACILGENPI